jgi:nucleotide-binding universal stress UspA family protein
VLGSVAEKVIRKAPCPVLTVPPRAHATSVLPFRRVLCAVDFSESSVEGLHYACSLARVSDAAVTVLHVIEWPWSEPPAPTFDDLPAAQAAALKEFRRYLETAATNQLKTIVTDVSMRVGLEVVVRHGKPYVGILDLAEEVHADLIVIGLHGRNPAEMASFGSTTTQVVRRARCSVLTLKR